MGWFKRVREAIGRTVGKGLKKAAPPPPPPPPPTAPPRPEEPPEEPDVVELRDNGWLNSGSSDTIRYTFMTPGEALRYINGLVGAGVPEYLPDCRQHGPHTWTVYCDRTS